MQVPTHYTNLADKLSTYVDALIATNDFDTIHKGYHSDAYGNAKSELYWGCPGYRIDIQDNDTRIKSALADLAETKYGKIEFHHVDAKAATADDVLRGTVLYSSWGYDQTNVDYYIVIKRTPKTVTCLPMTMTETADSVMTGTALPGEVQYEAEPIRRSIRETSYGVRINGPEKFQSCYVWNGRAKYVSHYH